VVLVSAVGFPRWRLAGEAEKPEKTTRPLGWRTSTLSSRVSSIGLCLQTQLEPGLAGIGVEAGVEAEAGLELDFESEVEVDSAGPRTEVDVPANPCE
jgi:hypothetical protein